MNTIAEKVVNAGNYVTKEQMNTLTSGYKQERWADARAGDGPACDHGFRAGQEATRSQLRRYEPPKMRVLGSVRVLTTGSSSSGKKDANSQYYW